MHFVSVADFGIDTQDNCCVRVTRGVTGCISHPLLSPVVVVLGRAGERGRGGLGGRGKRPFALIRSARMDWTGLDWTALDGTGRHWPGLDGTGLAWTALAWTDKECDCVFDRKQAAGRLLDAHDARLRPRLRLRLRLRRTPLPLLEQELPPPAATEATIWAFICNAMLAGQEKQQEQRRR